MCGPTLIEEIIMLLNKGIVSLYKPEILNQTDHLFGKHMLKKEYS